MGPIETTTNPGYLAILAKADGPFREGSVEDSIVSLMAATTDPG
jgi:hypothetical protein